MNSTNSPKASIFSLQSSKENPSTKLSKVDRLTGTRLGQLAVLDHAQSKTHSKGLTEEAITRVAPE